MIRAVLAVALASAIVAVAVPAIDDARERRSDRLVRGEVAALERAAGSLLGADEVAPGVGARRVVVVTLPHRSWSAAGVDALTVRGSVAVARERSAVTYRIAGRRRTVDVDLPLYTPGGPVVVRDHARVALELVGVEGRIAVRVRPVTRTPPTTRPPPLPSGGLYPNPRPPRAMSLLDRIGGKSSRPACGCDPAFEDGRLVVDAGDCPGDGRLADRPACRAAVIGALTRRDAEGVVVRTGGAERTYADTGTALLLAAGRFADRVAFHDERLAARTRRDPLRAARDATARAGPVADLAAETGLAAVADRVGATGPLASVDYGSVLRSTTVPAITRMRVDTRPPCEATVEGVEQLDSGAVARVYATTTGRRYHLHPPELDLDSESLATLAAAHERLADGRGEAHPDRAPERAVRSVAGDGDPVVLLSGLLRKHTRGYGVLTDFFADERISDVYASAPVGETPLRVVLDGTEVPTNVSLTPDGAEAFASRLRRESGRAFSRASPTLDATASLPSGRIRVAAVTDPVSDGTAFAFRDHGRETWTLPALVENGTVTAGAAAFLSLAVERDAAILVAGPRNAGKTTTLGALLWELPRTTRTLVVEDTPELPVGALQEDGRDVQALRTATDDGPGIDPAEALRTGLRLGDSALVVGEVRGEEASVLYEAMRVGASDDAVLGTVHGTDAEAVRERVTTDLGVAPSSFAATDLVVTLASVRTGAGRRRRVQRVEEVVRTEDGVRFATLYERTGTDLEATGRVRRGNSHLAASLTLPGESYDELLGVLRQRTESLSKLADRGRTRPEAFRSVYARRGGER